MVLQWTSPSGAPTTPTESSAPSWTRQMKGLGSRSAALAPTVVSSAKLKPVSNTTLLFLLITIEMTVKCNITSVRGLTTCWIFSLQTPLAPQWPWAFLSSSSSSSCWVLPFTCTRRTEAASPPRCAMRERMTSRTPPPAFTQTELAASGSIYLLPDALQLLFKKKKRKENYLLFLLSDFMESFVIIVE